MKDFFKYTLATIVGITVVSIISFFLFFMVVGVIISSTEQQATVSDNSLLILKLNRKIVDRAPVDPFEGLNIPGFKQGKRAGLNDILKSIEKASYDSRIKGIYLKLSVVKGGIATVEEIRNALKAFKEKCGKPIYAYADFYGQKAYYLASVADTIVINPQGAIDFRGLGGEMMFYKKALEKLGVEAQIVRHGKFKAAVEPFMLEKMSSANREQTMTYLNSLWGHILKGISEERGIPVERLNELADQVQTFEKGDKAVEKGLADFAKYKDQVLDDLRALTGITGNKGVPVIAPSDYADVYVKKPEKGRKGFSKNKIAVIYASGDIGVSIDGNGIDGDNLSREIRAARQDSNYKAIVLRINSPGGSAFVSDVIWREVKLAAQEKVVIASLGDVAASGGYYIACAADKIVASPNTITGSIGIFGVIPNMGELLNDKLGITIDAVRTNKHSDFITITRGMTDFEHGLLQQSIEEGYDTFISRVADGRGMDKAAVDKIGQGRVWTGENALDIGLIDVLGGLNDAITLAAETSGLENYRVVSLPKQSDPFEELFKTGPDKIRNWMIKKELGESAKYYEFLRKATQLKGVYARMPYDIIIQ